MAKNQSSRGKRNSKVAHQSPGRIRLRLSSTLAPDEAKQIIDDLKLSPEVKDARVNGRSLVIEHTGQNEHPWSLLEKYFPQSEKWSDEIDAAVSKATETPEMNKLLPLGFLAFAIGKAFRDGAFFAGESAFAMAYIAFDLYWKFQQENVTRKIQRGLTKQQEGATDQQAA